MTRGYRSTMLLFLSLLLASVSYAQPVFTRAFLDVFLGENVAGETFYAVAGQEAKIQALIDLEGANRTWDLTSFVFDPTSDAYSEDFIALPADLLGSNNPAFANATFAIRSFDAGKSAVLPQYVSYYSLSDTEFNQLGYYSFDGVETVGIVFDAPFLQFPFPFQFGSVWQGQGDFTIESGEPPPAPATISVSQQESGDADSWGTLITPAGSIPVIRFEQMRQTLYDGIPFSTERSIVFFSGLGIEAEISITPNFPFPGDILELDYSVNSTGGIVQAPVDAPGIFYPAENAINLPLNPILVWLAAVGAATYDLQVATDLSFKTGGSSALVVDETGIANTEYQVSGLASLSTYYWRVRAVNDGGDGPWSNPRSFSTAENVAIDQLSNQAPTAFHLYTNYPNPFNPVTTIRFDVPENSSVHLSVYDTLGRELDVLVSEQMQPGSYEYRWDATNRPSGVFLYRLTANAYSQTGTMILLK